jgi:preprotein translocase subunit YajC
MASENLIELSIALSPLTLLAAWMGGMMLKLRKASKIDEAKQSKDQALSKSVVNEPSVKLNGFFSFTNSKYGFLVPIVIFGVMFYFVQRVNFGLIENTPIDEILLIIVVFISIHSFIKARDDRYKERADNYKYTGQGERAWSRSISKFWVLVTMASYIPLNFVLLNLLINLDFNLISLFCIFIFIPLFFASRYLKKTAYNLVDLSLKKKAAFYSGKDKINK